MRKYLFAALTAIGFHISAFCQSHVGESRRTNFDHVFKQYDPDTKKALLSNNKVVSKTIPGTSSFTITDQTDDGYVIYFWRWKGKGKEAVRKRKDFNYNDDDESKIKYFLIDKTQLDIVSSQVYSTWSPTVGILTFPFKLRLQTPRQVEPAFSIGVSGGVTWDPWRANRSTFSLLLGVAASSAKIDQYNTDPAAGVKDATEQAAVTSSLTLLWQWNQLQLGISGGIDNIFDNHVLKWRFQGNPWVSMGIGYTIFSSNTVKRPGTN